MTVGGNAYTGEFTTYIGDQLAKFPGERKPNGIAEGDKTDAFFKDRCTYL